MIHLTTWTAFHCWQTYISTSIITLIQCYVQSPKRLQFLPRDAMRKRGFWLSSGVRPSVRLSCIVSTRLKISSNFFLGPVAPSFCFFRPPKRLYPIPRRTPSAGAKNTRGWEKFAIFDWNHSLSRKRYDIGPWLPLNVTRKSHRRRIDPCRFRWPWVTPNPGFKVTVYLLVEYLKNGAS